CRHQLITFATITARRSVTRCIQLRPLRKNSRSVPRAGTPARTISTKTVRTTPVARTRAEQTENPRSPLRRQSQGSRSQRDAVCRRARSSRRAGYPAAITCQTRTRSTARSAAMTWDSRTSTFPTTSTTTRLSPPLRNTTRGFALFSRKRTRRPTTPSSRSSSRRSTGSTRHISQNSAAPYRRNPLCAVRQRCLRGFAQRRFSGSSRKRAASSSQTRSPRSSRRVSACGERDSSDTSCAPPASAQIFPGLGARYFRKRRAPPPRESAPHQRRAGYDDSGSPCTPTTTTDVNAAPIPGSPPLPQFKQEEPQENHVLGDGVDLGGPAADTEVAQGHPTADPPRNGAGAPTVQVKQEEPDAGTDQALIPAEIRIQLI
ncbi:hypothetical protein AAVH_39087, partial [Aphelenchoides avenae]